MLLTRARLLSPRVSRLKWRLPIQRHFSTLEGGFGGDPEDPPYHSDADAEPLWRYMWDGYHPVHLDDRFKDGRYEIVNKLGWGNFSTVWLAHDTKLSKNVALKILVAELDKKCSEFRILRMLGQDPVASRYTAPLLDHFNHDGPNGTHLCLVSEALGQGVSNRAESYSSGRLPGPLAWQVARQTVEALAFIHEKGITHGDIHPGNLLMTFPRLANATSLEELVELTGQRAIAEVIVSEGQLQTISMPEYQIENACMRSNDEDIGIPVAKLVDFSSAFEQNEMGRLECALAFASPEAQSAGEFGQKHDIWSLGCTLYEIVIGYSPFDTQTYERDEVIQAWISDFGPPPDEMNFEIEDIKPKGRDGHQDFGRRLRAAYFDETKQPYFTQEEIDEFVSLLGSIFKYKPVDRPSAAQLLDHPWLRNKPLHR